MKTQITRVLPLLLLANLAPVMALAAAPPADQARPPSATSVHHFNGQRVDVPQHDLAADGSGLLRNGLTPEPLEGG